MINIVLTLVFSVVMLIFMIFPAMKIVEWIEKRVKISVKWHNSLVFVVVFLLSLSIGLFLKLA